MIEQKQNVLDVHFVSVVRDRFVIGDVISSITIEFGIDDNQMSLISLWRSRNKTQKYLFFIV